MGLKNSGRRREIDKNGFYLEFGKCFTTFNHCAISKTNIFKVLNEVEDCRVSIHKKKEASCSSYFKCFINITAVDINEWIWADQRWTTV